MANKHVIFLVGFMGSGKTHYGKLLASAMGVPFADLDAFIEAEEGMTITEIFKLKGESYFRACESRILRTVPAFFSTHIINIHHKFSIFGVLSCGGGTPCFNRNMEWMNEHGITVWIAPDIDILVERLVGEQEKRPLIAGLSKTELRNQVEQRLHDREMYYRQSNLQITNPSISVQELHEQILHSQALF
jgi:shikimate kinase